MRIEEGYATDIITDLSLDWAEGLAGDEPYCLLIHHKAPHRNWQHNPKHEGMYSEPIAVPDTFVDDYAGRSSEAKHAAMRIADNLTLSDLKVEPPADLDPETLALWKYQRYMEDYLACVASVDENVGRVIDWLKERGEFDNTLLMYTSDQGVFLGDHGWFDKRFIYEESIRMPLVLSYPDAITPGEPLDQMVTNVDFAQTILQAAGVEPHERMQGVSFFPQLTTGPTAPTHEGVYYRYYENDDENHHVLANYGIRTERYKLIYFSNDGMGLPGTSEHLYVPEWEMHDMLLDPDELANVYRDAGYLKVREDLKVQLWKLQERLGDEPHHSRPVPENLVRKPLEGSSVQEPLRTFAGRTSHPMLPAKAPKKSKGSTRGSPSPGSHRHGCPARRYIPEGIGELLSRGSAGAHGDRARFRNRCPPGDKRAIRRLRGRHGIHKRCRPRSGRHGVPATFRCRKGRRLTGLHPDRRTRGPEELEGMVALANRRRPAGPGSTIASLARHPVVQVSFEDAQAYARWAGKRLPTEIEFEYAARGGLDGADYSWGDAEPDPRDQPANTWQGDFPYRNTGARGFAGTSVVGSFAANGYGLLDMIGSVWEWTTSKFTADHDASVATVPEGCACGPGVSPGAGPETRLVLKGGSHLCAPEYRHRYRPAAGSPQTADSATTHVGFAASGSEARPREP